jgi:hypothetical protein
VTCNRWRPAVSQLGSRVTRLSLIFGLGLLSFLHPAALRASGEQLDPRQPYALIFGTVWGPDDRPVYGVKVKIRRADQKRARWQLYSNHTGEFAQRLPAGKADYVVWADTKGLKSLTGNKLEPGSEVAVHIESDERADVGLHLK